MKLCSLVNGVSSTCLVRWNLTRCIRALRDGYAGVIDLDKYQLICYAEDEICLQLGSDQQST